VPAKVIELDPDGIWRHVEFGCKSAQISANPRIEEELDQDLDAGPGGYDRINDVDVIRHNI
jgi:hypothetical protein